MARQPVTQRQPFSRRGPERAYLLQPVAVRARDAQTGRHALLLHVQPTSTLDDAFHGGLLRQGAETERSHPDREFARRARGNSAGYRTLPRHVMAGLLGTTLVRRSSASACTNGSLLSSSEGGSPPMTVMGNDNHIHRGYARPWSFQRPGR